jgi:hypothetical protein
MPRLAEPSISPTETPKRTRKPKPKSSHETRTYDWLTISNEYIQGYFLTDPLTGKRAHYYPTYKELAEKYSCSYGHLTKKGADQNWEARRKAFQSKIQDKLTASQVKSILSESADFDALTLDILRKLFAVANAYLHRYNFIYNAPDGLDSLDLEDLQGIKPSELKQITEIITQCQTLVRRTVGEPLQADDKKFEKLLDIFRTEGGDSEKANEQAIETLTTRREEAKKLLAKYRQELNGIEK